MGDSKNLEEPFLVQRHQYRRQTVFL